MSDSEEETKKRRTKKNVSIMLWGKKKASQSQLDEVLKSPIKTVKKTEKPTKKGVKTVKEQRTHYDPTLEYTVNDIDFLEQELEKLNDDYENQKFDRLEDSNVKKYYDIKKNIEDDEKEDILYKMIDKLERLVEVLKDYQGDKEGKGLDTDSDEEDNKRLDAYFDKMEAEIAKKPPKTSKKEPKQETPKQVTKARAEKGSEEAKAKMAKLTAIRQAKKAEKDKEKEKEKQAKSMEKESKKKPYFYIGPLPKGYRKATEDEALLEEMFTEYGENQINPTKLKYYEKYRLIVSPDKTPNQIAITLKGLNKRVERIFTDIDILESQLRSAKSSEDIDRLKDRIEQRTKLNKDFKKTEEGKRFKEKLKQLQSTDYAKGIETRLKEKQDELKDVKKIYRYYQKLYSQKTGKEVELLKEFKRKVPEYVAPKETTPKESKPLPKSPLELLREELIELSKARKALKPPPPPPKTTHTFENHKGQVEIPKKYFDEKMVLHPKYAQKLHKKDVILHPHHYDKEHTEKYFYKHIKGGAIGTYDLQKLLKQSYNPNLGNVGDYMVDDEISNPTTQVYRNKNTDKVYVVHRGTKGARDWLNNFVYGLSPTMYKMTDRYKNAKATQDKALEKYKGYDIDVLGHSQGSKLAEMVSKDNKNVKNVITYNRPQGLMESLWSKPKNLHDIKTSFDPVSPLIPFQRGNQAKVIKSTTYNPLTEHGTEAILREPDQLIGTGLVNRKPDLNQHSIIQSVVFERPLWTKPKAIKWLKECDYYHDEIDMKPTQIRFRQYNPEDFYNYHYITKPLKDKGILLIIAMRNAQGGTLHRSCGQGFMVNNVEHYTPNEALIKNTKLLTGHVLDEIKEHKKLAKEAKTTLKRTKSMNKASLKQSLKGSQTMKERMAKLRAMKKK
jgi:hypothetical protein